MSNSHIKAGLFHHLNVVLQEKNVQNPPLLQKSRTSHAFHRVLVQGKKNLHEAK